MKTLLFKLALAIVAMPRLCAAGILSTPAVTQDANQLVTITYSLMADSIVTMEILTNETVQVDASDYWNLEGDVNKLVKAGERTITWQPDSTWPASDLATGFKVKLTAWPANKPPLYMVVNLDEATGKDVRYYASSNAIPGGILGSPCYRDTKMVFRRIDAKGIPWQMGNKNSGGSAVDVTLGNDFWFGVFEVTRGQWFNVRGTYESNGFLGSFWAIRPMQYVSFATIREAETNVQNDDYDYPALPHPGSFLGILRNRTGVAFDLPSEAQWEFGGRAGCAITVWNDGSGLNTDVTCPGRNRYNGGWNQTVNPETGEITYSETLTSAQANSPEWGTAPSGMYGQSCWGIYDIHGNVYEICLDHWCEKHADKGADLVATGGVYKVASGSHNRTIRGGNWRQVPSNTRCTYRSSQTDANTSGGYAGFRVVCTIPAGETEPESVESSVTAVETRGFLQTLSMAGKLFWTGTGLMLLFR